MTCAVSGDKSARRHPLLCARARFFLLTPRVFFSHLRHRVNRVPERSDSAFTSLSREWIGNRRETDSRGGYILSEWARWAYEFGERQTSFPEFLGGRKNIFPAHSRDRGALLPPRVYPLLRKICYRCSRRRRIRYPPARHASMAPSATLTCAPVFPSFLCTSPGLPGILVPGSGSLAT